MRLIAVSVQLGPAAIGRPVPLRVQKTAMRPIQLRGTELKSSALGFGCANLMGRVGRRESLRALELAFDQGISYFDTARSYGWGKSEGSVCGSTLCDGTDYGSPEESWLWLSPAKWTGTDTARPGRGSCRLHRVLVAENARWPGSAARQLEVVAGFAVQWWFRRGRRPLSVPVEVDGPGYSTAMSPAQSTGDNHQHTSRWR